MNKKIRSDLTDKLFRAILSMETIDECYLLFEDLCTVNEIQAIAQRMEVAAMLDAKCTYGTDGYKLAIKRVKAQQEQKNTETGER